jgi:hypothetical protein
MGDLFVDQKIANPTSLWSGEEFNHFWISTGGYTFFTITAQVRA